MISVLGKDVFSTVEEIVDPSHTALVMIDIQHDFCSPKGLFDRIGKNLQMMAPAVERVSKLIAKARSVGSAASRLARSLSKISGGNRP